MTHVCDCSSGAYRTRCTGETICVSAEQRVTSRALFHLFSACRSIRRKCRRRGADINLRRDSLSWCLRPELLVQQTLCNVSLLLAAGIWREEKGGGGDKGPLVSLMERGEPNPQPPARRRGRAAVPHHTGALVPASEGRVTGWHVSRGDAFMFLCVCGRRCSPKGGTLDSLLGP